MIWISCYQENDYSFRTISLFLFLWALSVASWSQAYVITRYGFSTSINTLPCLSDQMVSQISAPEPLCNSGSADLPPPKHLPINHTFWSRLFNLGGSNASSLQYCGRIEKKEKNNSLPGLFLHQGKPISICSTLSFKEVDLFKMTSGWRRVNIRLLLLKVSSQSLGIWHSGLCIALSQGVNIVGQSWTTAVLWGQVEPGILAVLCQCSS